MIKSNLGGKDFFQFILLLLPCDKQSIAEECQSRSQGRNLEAGTEAGAMAEHCFLAYSPWLARPAFLNSPGPPTVIWVLLGPPVSTLSQSDVPKTSLYTLPMAVIPQLRFPLPRRP